MVVVEAGLLLDTERDDVGMRVVVVMRRRWRREDSRVVGGRETAVVQALWMLDCVSGCFKVESARAIAGMIMWAVKSAER